MTDGDSYICDADSIRRIIDRFRARGIDLVVDYEHQTEGGDYASPDGTAPAAGWVKELEDRGPDGLWARVQWTDRAMNLLRAREYRYFSPVFLYDRQTRRIAELVSIALTNTPRTVGIQPIVAKNDSPHRKENDMEFLKAAAKLLDLQESSTEDQVLAAIRASREKPAYGKAVAAALDLPETASESEIVATIHAIKQRPDLSAEVAALKSRLAARDRDDLVAAALKEGKITPAQKEWADRYALNDPDGFRVFVAKAPVVVPMAGIDDRKPAATETASIDDEQRAINRMLGIDDETFKKFSK